MEKLFVLPYRNKFKTFNFILFYKTFKGVCYIRMSMNFFWNFKNEYIFKQLFMENIFFNSHNPSRTGKTF